MQHKKIYCMLYTCIFKNVKAHRDGHAKNQRHVYVLAKNQRHVYVL